LPTELRGAPWRRPASEAGIENASKVFANEVEAVDDVSLEFADPEFLVPERRVERAAKPPSPLPRRLRRAYAGPPRRGAATLPGTRRGAGAVERGGLENR
jgi:hypothetical protein